MRAAMSASACLISNLGLLVGDGWVHLVHPNMPQKCGYQMYSGRGRLVDLSQSCASKFLWHKSLELFQARKVSGTHPLQLALGWAGILWGGLLFFFSWGQGKYQEINALMIIDDTNKNTQYAIGSRVPNPWNSMAVSALHQWTTNPSPFASGRALGFHWCLSGTVSMAVGSLWPCIAQDSASCPPRLHD